MIIHVILIIIMLLFLIIFIRKFKLSGGYNTGKFKASLTQPNNTDYLSPNINPDLYFKTLFYKVYKQKTIRGIKITGFVPQGIRYIDGGYDNINEVSTLARERVYFENDSVTFEPDFIIKIEDKYLLIEFDENNEYHQDSTNFRYQTKNLIYSELLDTTTPDQNIVIFRICYNSGVNKYKTRKNNEVDARKDDTEKLVIQKTNWLINKMIDNQISNQYVLMKLEADSAIKSKPEWHTRISELIGIKKKEDVEFETPYTYFVLNLNTRKFFDVDDVDINRFFIITNFLRR